MDGPTSQAHEAAGIAFCSDACTVMAHQDCTVMARLCDFKPTNFAHAGGYVMVCHGAIAAACGLATGMHTCVNDCTGGKYQGDADESDGED